MHIYIYTYTTNLQEHTYHVALGFASLASPLEPWGDLAGSWGDRGDGTISWADFLGSEINHRQMIFNDYGDIFMRFIAGRFSCVNGGFFRGFNGNINFIYQQYDIWVCLKMWIAEITIKYWYLGHDFCHWILENREAHFQTDPFVTPAGWMDHNQSL